MPAAHRILPDRPRALLGACLLLCAAACAPIDRQTPTLVACDDLTPGAPAGAPHHVRAETRLMGTSFQIRAVAEDTDRACHAINDAFDEVRRQEAQLSEYRPTSAISAINNGAGLSPVPVDPEVFTLVLRSVWASEVTSGAFDVTFAGCGRLWSIREQRIPSSDAIAECLPDVGYRRIRFDPWRSSVFLPSAGMRIGLGGIAKGHGVDRAVDVLLSRGLTRFVVDGGGDLRVEGTDIDGAWTVLVADPREPGGVVERLHLDRGAIVTSGDYLRFFERDGVRYHHILDPATGQPARRTVAVTVIAQTATDADALATGLFVLGPERGLAVVARLPGVEALFVDSNLIVSASRGFPRTHSRSASGRPTPLP